MKHIYTTLLLFVPLGLFAQNWKTVSNSDTVYLEAGIHKVGFPEQEDSNVLKVIWIDSSKQVNSDSVYFFYPSIRGVAMDSCLDTVAASWLGKKFVRTSNGIEYFFNSYGDTITIKTMAELNDSWVLAKDVQGMVFKGTVSAAGTMLIDNTTDSFKTITIQAYNNNAPVASMYNNRVFQLSKEHGWVKTLDLYRFPNDVFGWEDFGAVIDTTQHTRLNEDFKALDLKKIDLSWKYAPGNEWIEYDQSGELPYTVQQETLTYDSVISSSLISPDTVMVQFKTDRYTAIWPLQQVTTNTWLHTDTIYNAVPMPLSQYVIPEYNAGGLGQNPQRFFKRYFADTFCNNMWIVRSHGFDGLPLNYFGCWAVTQGVSGQFIRDTTLLPRFGILALNSEDHYIPPFTFSKTFYSYLHLGACTWGTKVNVIALGVEHINSTPTFYIYPNPANDKVFLQSNNAGAPLVITIFDITGRTLRQQTSTSESTELSTKGYAPGIYILSVKDKGSVTTYKLEIE